MYQDDNGLWDVPEHHSNTRDFLHAAGWAAAGYVAGSRLDGTRFGRWFNTSKFIGGIFTLIKVAVLALALFYVYCVIKVW